MVAAHAIAGIQSRVKLVIETFSWSLPADLNQCQGDYAYHQESSQGGQQDGYQGLKLLINAASETDTLIDRGSVPSI
ncbi:hypothetical protein CEXT_562331 [Caerostris extrusa]|uniref:Uncharacterized protein n=1 Tax=Caerostris extrusa TaxID=172846 RepID=A0AAV4PTL7_CAEEX|nr:hypothetical protein CEXT_562331 [Caerostris extrusa]